MSDLPTKVLVVDPDASVSNGISNTLQRHQINVQKAVDGNSALYLIERTRFDCVIIDPTLEDLPGLALVQKIKNHPDKDKRTAGIMYFQGASISPTDAGLIKELGDIEIIRKPINHPQMLSILSKAYANKKKAIIYEQVADEARQRSANSGVPDALAFIKTNLAQIGSRGLDLMVEIYISSNQLQDALQLVSGQLSKDPENPRLLNLQAQLQFQIGNHEEALTTFERLDKTAPGHLQRMQSMADGYLETNAPDRSLNYYAQLVRCNPEITDYKFQAIGKLQEAGHPDFAKKLGQETATPMEIVRYYNNRGVELSKNGDTQKALNEYRTALNFFPKFKENYRIYYNMALAYKSRKTRTDFEEAKICLEQCLELSPGYDKGMKALEIISKALATKPKK